MDNLKKFEWKCPSVACEELITALSESGLEIKRGFHEGRHKREHEYALGPESPKPAKDLSVLELTVTDKGFLKTRGISYDE